MFLNTLQGGWVGADLRHHPCSSIQPCPQLALARRNAPRSRTEAWGLSSTARFQMHWWWVYFARFSKPGIPGHPVSQHWGSSSALPSWLCWNWPHAACALAWCGPSSTVGTWTLVSCWIKELPPNLHMFTSSPILYFSPPCQFATWNLFQVFFWPFVD